MKIRPSDMQPGKFGVQAWLWGAADQPGLLPQEAVVAEAGIEAELDRIRRKLVAQGVNLKQVCIEVFLPRALLDRGVDPWKVDPFPSRDGLPAKLVLPTSKAFGAVHPVVIRPLERISSAPFLDEVRRRWQAAQRITGGSRCGIRGND